MSNVEICFQVNGRPVRVLAAPETLLADLLRDELGLTGVKIGCREGECGACTVLLDGEPVNSCILPAMKAAGREVTTIEGLEAEDGALDRIQQSFIDAGATQCGFCTPAMLLNAKALLDHDPSPSEGRIRQALSGVLCRCTGYRKIVQAVIDTSQKS